MKPDTKECYLYGVGQLFAISERLITILASLRKRLSNDPAGAPVPHETPQNRASALDVPPRGG